MPLDDSLCVPHFWAHTVRKLLPASSVDDVSRPDMIPHISGAIIICWMRWSICWGSDSSNMKGVYVNKHQ